MVAYAAHAIPKSKTKMKRGSNRVLITAQIIIDNIANLGFPSALIIELSVIQIIKKGIPNVIIQP